MLDYFAICENMKNWESTNSEQKAYLKWNTRDAHNLHHNEEIRKMCWFVLHRGSYVALDTLRVTTSTNDSTYTQNGCRKAVIRTLPWYYINIGIAERKNVFIYDLHSSSHHISSERMQNYPNWKPLCTLSLAIRFEAMHIQFNWPINCDGWDFRKNSISIQFRTFLIFKLTFPSFADAPSSLFTATDKFKWQSVYREFNWKLEIFYFYDEDDEDGDDDYIDLSLKWRTKNNINQQINYNTIRSLNVLHRTWTRSDWNAREKRGIRKQYEFSEEKKLFARN